MEFEVKPTFYRISIDPSTLTTEALGAGEAGDQRDGFIENRTVLQLMKGIDLGVGFAAYKATTGPGIDDGFIAPANRDVSKGKARGYLRWLKLLQYIQENQTIVDLREIDKTYADPNDPNNSEITLFEFTVGYLRNDSVYTHNTENVAGTTSPATEPLFYEEEALNRQIARMLVYGYATFEYYFDPDNAENPRRHEVVNAAGLAPDFPTAQAAITVTKIDVK